MDKNKTKVEAVKIVCKICIFVLTFSMLKAFSNQDKLQKQEEAQRQKNHGELQKQKEAQAQQNQDKLQKQDEAQVQNNITLNKNDPFLSLEEKENLIKGILQELNTYQYKPELKKSLARLNRWSWIKLDAVYFSKLLENQKLLEKHLYDYIRLTIIDDAIAYSVNDNYNSDLNLDKLNKVIAYFLNPLSQNSNGFLKKWDAKNYNGLVLQKIYQSLSQKNFTGRNLLFNLVLIDSDSARNKLFEHLTSPQINLDINSKDIFGNTPLHFTMDFNLAEELIEKGAKVVKNSRGEWPMIINNPETSPSVRQFNEAQKDEFIYNKIIKSEKLIKQAMLEEIDEKDVEAVRAQQRVLNENKILGLNDILFQNSSKSLMAPVDKSYNDYSPKSDKFPNPKKMQACKNKKCSSFEAKKTSENKIFQDKTLKEKTPKDNTQSKKTSEVDASKKTSKVDAQKEKIYQEEIDQEKTLKKKTQHNKAIQKNDAKKSHTKTHLMSKDAPPPSCSSNFSSSSSRKKNIKK